MMEQYAVAAPERSAKQSSGLCKGSPITNPLDMPRLDMARP